MSEIYYDLFVTDQYIDQVHTFRSAADSLDVYAGIFEKHGYSTEEFLASLDYYIKNADKFEKILKHTQNEIKARYDFLMQQPEEAPAVIKEELEQVDNPAISDVEDNEKEPGEVPAQFDKKLQNPDDAQKADKKSDKNVRKENKVSRKQLKQLEKKLK
jgi:hypothetical protein